MTARAQQFWTAVGAMVVAGLAAAAVPPPPALVPGQSSLPRAFAALASAGIVALAAVPSLIGRGARRRAGWAAVAVVSFAAGVLAFVINASATRTCTAQYDGRSAVIGTEWTPLGQRYAFENPGLSNAELLFDSAGVADRIWTRASIERCRVRLGVTYALWIPCLVVCLLAAAQASLTNALALPARTAAMATAASGGGSTGTSLRYDVFISYRHGGRDGEFARELLLALERDGYRVAIDERDFPANASFLLEMERCVRESRFTVSLLSPRYLGSGHCEEEAVLCKVLDMGDRKRRLIPMVVEPVELPVWLFGIVGIDCTKPDPLVDPLDRLRAVLGTPLPRA
jgi:hypothetical protein